MGRWHDLEMGLAGLGTALTIALILTGCGASLDSGVSPTTSPQTPATASASPTATASASASACVSPGDTEATYQLAGAKILAGNLQIKDNTVGTGATAADGDKIKVTYVGSLPDGTVFDRSTNDAGGKPISFTLATGKVIAGWVEGIAGMRVGGTRELVIPAALAYGCTADGKIPADSTLIFTVQLVAVS